MTQQYVQKRDPVADLAAFVKNGCQGTRPPIGVTNSLGYHTGILVGTVVQFTMDIPVVGDMIQCGKIGYLEAEMRANTRRAMQAQQQPPVRTGPIHPSSLDEAGSVIC